MATLASKRKQDEKHLKMLREIVALSHNKQCLDCHQRGPTYVNMTIGSFVCTSCSGILRGLNPPHRVKSISMATFSTDEMEFLKSRGNEFGRKVWLCRFKPSVHREPDSKDEHKVKDFMSDKYEKKRYYTEDTEALHEEARRMNTPPVKPDPKQLRSMAGNHLPILKVDQTKPAAVPPPPIGQPAPVVNQAASASTVPVSVPIPASTAKPAINKPVGFDLLADLGADPFTGAANNTAPAPTTGFANFSDFGSAAVTSPPQTTATFPAADLLQPLNSQPQQSAPVSTPSSSTIAGLSASDKYAALASLDTALGGGGSAATVNWETGWNTSAAPSNLFGASSNSEVTANVNSTAGFPVNTNTTASNPFGGSQTQFGTPPQNPATTPGANPFMVAGFSQQQQATSFNQFQQTSAPSTGFAQFPQASVPVNSAPGQGFPVQNGGFGTKVTASQPGFGMPAFAATPGQFTAQGGQQFPPQGGQQFPPQGGQQFPPQGGQQFPPQGGQQFPPQGGQQFPQQGGQLFSQQGGQPFSQQGGQFGAKMGQIPAVPASAQQQQQFASWGVPSTGAAVGNPFMTQAAQQVVPPRGSSTNPFL